MKAFSYDLSKDYKSDPKITIRKMKNICEHCGAKKRLAEYINQWTQNAMAYIKKSGRQVFSLHLPLIQSVLKYQMNFIKIKKAIKSPCIITRVFYEK